MDQFPAHTTTPRSISEPIKRLCRELVDNPEPRFVEVTPAEEAKSERLLPDCRAAGAASGGFNLLRMADLGVARSDGRIRIPRCMEGS